MVHASIDSDFAGKPRKKKYKKRAMVTKSKSDEQVKMSNNIFMILFSHLNYVYVVYVYGMFFLRRLSFNDSLGVFLIFRSW